MVATTPERVQRPNAPLGPAALVALQRQAGNRAVAGLLTLQRAPRTLGASRFKGEQTLEAVLNDKARVNQLSPAEPVRRIQQALLDVARAKGRKYDLGTSGPAGDGVDGTYGSRTITTVKRFKSDEGLGSTQLGDVGPGTMGRLDDFFLTNEPPKEQKIEPGTAPANMTGVTVKPAVVDSKGKVDQKPETKVTVDSTTKLPAEDPEKEPTFDGSITVQGQLPFRVNGKPKETQFCDFGEISVAGKWNYTLIPIRNRVLLFSEPALEVGLLPLVCKKPPTLDLQLNILKLTLFDKIGVSLLAGIGAKDPFQLRGWAASGGIVFETELGRLGNHPVKLQFGVKGEVPLTREREPDGTLKERADLKAATGLTLEF